MGDVGRYIRILLIPSAAYIMAGIVSGGSGGFKAIEPPPPNPLAFISWLLSTAGYIVGAAASAASFPMLPDPVRVPLALLMGGLFIYGVVGLVAAVIQAVKPFG